MSDIDEVKSRLNIVDIVGGRVPLKKAGRNFKACCPFHNEKTPSFIVSPERQTFHCFGCGKGGSVIDFVMEYEHVDFREALETLAEKAGVKLERQDDYSPEAKLKTKIYEINHLASEFYHYILTKHALGEKARDYIATRGVHEKTVKTFMLGYSPNSWNALTNFLRKKGYDEDLLEKAGLLIPSHRGGYDRFRGRVMFTLKDHRGNVVGFSGRVLDSTSKGLPAARQEAKYINTSETPVYIKSHLLYGLDVTKGAIQKENEAIIMEGEFDVISSFQAGISNVVAIKGSALTEDHVRLLRRFTERIVLSLDSDLAGDAAMRRGITIAEQAGLEIKVVEVPVGKDPDEAARENPILFKKAIENAIPIYDYYIHSGLKRYDSKTAFGKKKISEELLPVIFQIENPIVQAHYIRKLSESLDTPEQYIQEGLKKLPKTNTFTPKTETEKVTKDTDRTRTEKIEYLLLAFLLQTKTTDFYEEFGEQIQLADITHPAIREIITALGNFLSSQTSFFIDDFARILPKELLPVLDEAFLWDLSSMSEDENSLYKGWLLTLQELRKSIIKRKIQQLTTEITHLASDTDATHLHSLEETLSQLTTQLRAIEKIS